MNNCLQIQHPHEDLKLLMDVYGWLPGPDSNQRPIG
jgi:hypothetical protein